MEQLQTIKMMMQMNKMALDNNYELMMNNYEQNNFLLYPFLNKSTEIPAEVKTAIDEWLQIYRKGFEGFKKMADDGYTMVEKSISSYGK